MKIYLHIGTEKTGSSYIQSLFARNKKQIAHSGVFYPSAGKWDREMLAGRISAGNGEWLTECLRSKNWARIERILHGHLKEARRHSCHSLLYSNEKLFEVFGEAGALEELLRICARLGLGRPHLLLVLRDPVSQALSLYKHRGKNGNIAEIGVWIANSYNLPINLSAFFNQLETVHLSCDVKKYKKDSSYLTRLFFDDWLGLEWPVDWVDAPVNPSLTLSELGILKQIRTFSPALVPLLYGRLLSIRVAEKSDDVFLKDYFLRTINSHLIKFHPLWVYCNNLLSPQEQLQLPETLLPSINSEKVFSFRESQTEQVILLLTKSASFSFRIRLVANKLRPFIATVKWKLRQMLGIA